MRYLKIILLIVITSLCFQSPLFSQTMKGYTYLQSLNTGLTRKMYANELMIDEQQNYLVVNYGNKPTYIVVFNYGTWEALVNFRLPDWVEFSGAYLDTETDNLYIKASRYSSEYYELNISTGDQVIKVCETLPGGCPVVEPKKAQKDIFSADKSFYIAINKKNERDVRVFKN